MTPTVHKDHAAGTMSITTEYTVPVERVWQVWADPRQLERWWGPPGYPATFSEHNLEPGGTVSYYMTGPDGDRFPGVWRVVAVESPRRLEFEDSFADAEGSPDTNFPTTLVTVTLEERETGRTTMEIHSRYPSVEAMQQLEEMGMEEGLVAALGQLDDLLADQAA